MCGTARLLTRWSPGIKHMLTGQHAAFWDPDHSLEGE